MGVKPTHMLLMQIQSDIGRRSLLGERTYAFVRQNKCVTFEERRDRAWLSYVCSVKHCTSMSCMYPLSSSVYLNCVRFRNSRWLLPAVWNALVQVHLHRSIEVNWKTSRMVLHSSLPWFPINSFSFALNNQSFPILTAAASAYVLTSWPLSCASLC